MPYQCPANHGIGALVKSSSVPKLVPYSNVSNVYLPLMHFQNTRELHTKNCKLKLFVVAFIAVNEEPCYNIALVQFVR